jgi:hypothetical protein
MSIFSILVVARVFVGELVNEVALETTFFKDYGEVVLSGFVSDRLNDG